MESFALLLLYLAIPSLLYSAVQHALTWKKKKQPGAAARFPGPKLFPVLGRVHDLPRFSMWLRLKEWADIYGPIYQTRMLNQTFIIVSDEKIAEELLVKRGHIYSGRPQIRSLFRHKEGPAYLALMDRHGMFHVSRPTPPERHQRLLTRREQTSGRDSGNGSTPPWRSRTGTASTDTWRTKPPGSSA